jgi:tRNA (mo5U34)-methyltransferase
MAYPPDEVISTAAHQEDVLLWRAFRGKRTGFYIDIGAGDPNYGSVTQWFYRVGWHGVNVEPHGVMFAVLQQWRPRDITLSCGVSDQPGSHSFYQVEANAAGHGWSFSSFDRMAAARVRHEGYVVQEIATETITLQDVADRYCGDTGVDFLRVAVEGDESKVIRSAEWSRFRPKVVCIQVIDSLSGESMDSLWEGILINANYDCALRDGANKYYVRHESPEILSQVGYPVGSSDRWRLATEHDFVAPWLPAVETPARPSAGPDDDSMLSIRNTPGGPAVKPSLDEILNEIDWWQRWEIVPGVFTPGINDVAFLLDHVRLPASLRGVRVLDIGGWNGAFSFECERRGASEVVMIEPSPVAGAGFDRIKAFLDSKVKYYQGSIYDLDPKWLGHFDIVLCFGIIYHLRYPLLGLDNIRRICRGELFVESATLESACWDGSHLVALGEIGPELENLPFLQFFEGSQFFDDTTNWFVPNAVATKAMIEAAGFEVLEHHVEGRYFAHARVKRGLPPMFAASHEGADYDLHARHLLGATSRWAAMD